MSNQILSSVKDGLEKKHAELVAAWKKEAAAAEEAAREALVGRKVEWEVEWVDRHSMQTVSISSAEVLDVYEEQDDYDYSGMPWLNMEVVLGYVHPETGETMEHFVSLRTLSRGQESIDEAWISHRRSQMEALQHALTESPLDYTIIVERTKGCGLLNAAASHPGATVITVDEDTQIEDLEKRILDAAGGTIVVHWVGQWLERYSRSSSCRGIRWILDVAIWERLRSGCLLDTRFVFVAEEGNFTSLLECDIGGMSHYFPSRSRAREGVLEGVLGIMPKKIVIRNNTKRNDSEEEA